MKSYATFSYELPYWQHNTYVIGIDEVGRGCLAGPVHVGGVCFPLLSADRQKELLQLKIHDSKQCTKQKRERLVPLIKENVIAWHICQSSVDDINTAGIVPAIEKAACTVVAMIAARLPAGAPLIVFTDTLPVKALRTYKQYSQIPIPQGDGKSITIAAASILAKVERDGCMDSLHQQFPAYGWNTNKGYATSLHRQAIREHGVSSLHRHLYVRKIL